MNEAVEPTTIPAPGALSVFLPFEVMEKRADGSLLVKAVINDETVDDENEIVDYDGAKTALDEFMKFANVREMHQKSAVGTVESIEHDDVMRKSTAILAVVDPTAILKVETKVYKGTSLGGWKRGLVKELNKASGLPVTRVKAPVINEISLVDRPSRPTALLSMLKVAGIAEPPADEPNDALTKDAGASTTPAVTSPAAVPGAVAGDTYIGEDGKAMAKDAPAEPAAAPAAPVAAPESIPAAAAAPDAPGATAAVPAADPAPAAPDEAVAMAYSVVIGDLAKRAATPSGDKSPLHVALAAFFPAPTPMPANAPELEPVAAVLEKVAGDDYSTALAKVAGVIESNLGTLASRSQIEAMQSSLTSMGETLEKVAKTPLVGGPLRYGSDPRRFEDAEAMMGGAGPKSGTVEGTLLAKLAADATDPVVKEALGKASVAADIRRSMGG